MQLRTAVVAIAIFLLVILSTFLVVLMANDFRRSSCRDCDVADCMQSTEVLDSTAIQRSIQYFSTNTLLSHQIGCSKKRWIFKISSSLMMSRINSTLSAALFLALDDEHGPATVSSRALVCYLYYQATNASPSLHAHLGNYISTRWMVY